MKNICKFITSWMGALVLLTALFALFVPAPLKSMGNAVINPMLGLIMFGMGMTLEGKDFKVLLQHPKEMLIGVMAQFTVMPSVAWLLVKLFSLPPDLAIGVILVGCCPGGTASNVITYLAKGNLALSVGMTATTTLLAP
ncbi:MAG: bile acid:sodium symporter family protein, partial [Bacteroidaceae bacterium]|nr:bile acid:sodium symporter family protein [Bacteroidaceae bacterium]